MELKRRSPSVIARLMGLDGLPSQQHAYDQQKRSSGNCQHSMTSVENAPRSGLYSGSRSHRKSSKGEQDFKDVFEIFEISKTKNNCYPLQQTLDSKLTKAKMAFIEQKFKDVKRLSTDEKLQGSKEFHDALEELDSNKDLLLKFLQQPDTLFTKHVHDFHDASMHSHRSRIAAMKSSDALLYSNGDLGFKLEKDALRKNNHRSPQTSNSVPFTPSVCRKSAYKSSKSSKIQLDGKVESAVLTTRIVVLKPNLWEMQDATKRFAPPHVFHTFTSESRKPTFPNIQCQETESLGKKTFQDEGFSRHKYRESREIAKEITRQMRNSFTNASMNLSSSGFRGGEESSSKISQNESPCESEVTSVNSDHSFVRRNQYTPSSSHSTGSPSVSREAKKRLSERWKVTHNSHEVTRGSTLGEMLAIPDMEERPASSDVIFDGKVSSGKLSRNDGHAGRFEPLGISSRDGWKDGCVRNLSRSRSLHALSAAFASPKRSKHLEARHSDRYLMPKDAVKQTRDKMVKENFNSREILLSQKLTPSKKKHQSFRCNITEGTDISPKVHFNRNLVKTNRNENDSHKPSFTISETTIVPENMVDEEHHHITKYCESPGNVVDPGHQMTMMSKSRDSEVSSHILVIGNPSIDCRDNLIPQEPSDGLSEEAFVHLHCPVAELESTSSSKDADQPSPLSVLEAPFTDDLSSGSECFESLSADLHGLRMQLQLLKLESDACIEGSMIIPSDEDVGEGCIVSSNHELISEGSLESSYLVDVLIDSGFSNANPETFISTCHSPEFPVSPLVFEKLESKYNDCPSFLLSKRRLLFDRINWGLREIYQQLLDSHPWVTPGRTKIGVKWSEDGLRDSLCKLLVSQEKKINQESAEMMLAGESQWLDLGADTDAIVKHIEQLLIDELVLEVVNM